MVARADVGSEEEMREVVRAGGERFGDIHGLIHAAGLAGEQTVSAISETGREHSERLFQAKVYGPLVLESIFRESELDFVVLISSLSSILGGIGFAAYAASNIFMDALAQRQNMPGLTPWVAINWDAWEFGGGDRSADDIPTDALGVLPEEGAEAFGRILHASDLPQVIVSTTDLHARIARWIELEQRAEPDASAAPSKLHSRPELPNTYRAPESDVEQTIAGTWQMLLGIERVGVDDSFFDLGGHSLLATQLISRLRDTFQIEISLRSFFEAPTIASLARVVVESVEERESKRLEQILEEVEGLPEADLDAALFSELQ
jgi:acyl carrier protein